MAKAVTPVDRCDASSDGRRVVAWRTSSFGRSLWRARVGDVRNRIRADEEFTDLMQHKDDSIHGELGIGHSDKIAQMQTMKAGASKTGARRRKIHC